MCFPSLKRFLFFVLALTTLASSFEAVAGPEDENGNGQISPAEISPRLGENRLVACPVPPEYADVPALREFIIRVCGRVADVLDHRTGEGTGDLATSLEAFRTELVRGAAQIGIDDVRAAGLSYDALRDFVISQTRGRGEVLQVMAYEQAVATANDWLKKMGFGFIRVEQHPKAVVLETFRNATARYPSKKGVTEDDVKAASDKAYPDNAATEIRVPISPEDIADPKLVLKFTRYHLVGDPDVRSVKEEPLPPAVEPLDNEKVWYRRMQAARFAITVGVMGTASWAAGGFSPEAAAVFLAGLGLETQFILASKYWRKFWAWGGFTGNAAVNIAYGGILASVQHLAEGMQGVPITFDLNEFLVRTGVLGATFVASFGGMQVVSARMKDEGELSEGRAMALETIGNVINNFGRFFATVAGMAGTSVVLGHMGPVAVDTNTVVGWAIQGAFFAAVTAPLWFRRLLGDDVRAGLVAYDLKLHNDPRHPYNGKLFGGIRKWCAEKVAAFSRFYTPRRVPPREGSTE